MLKIKDRLATGMGHQQHQNCQLHIVEPWRVNLLWTVSPMTSPQRSHLSFAEQPSKALEDRTKFLLVLLGKACSVTLLPCMAWGSSSSWCQGHICLRWMNPSLIVELCQPPKDVCSLVSSLSSTSVVLHLSCCSSLLAVGVQDIRRAREITQPLTEQCSGRQKGTHLSALLSLSSLWALESTSHSWCNGGLWMQSINISEPVFPW